jgi:hypothetical protein
VVDRVFASGFIVLAIVFALSGCGGADGHSEQIEANLAIWHALPTFPAAAFVTQGNEPNQRGGEVVGYTTRINYEVPAGTTAEDVIAFYIGALDDEWMHCDADQESVPIDMPGRTPSAIVVDVEAEAFVRNGGSVVVATFGMSFSESGGIYELLIDSFERADLCTN